MSDERLIHQVEEILIEANDSSGSGCSCEENCTCGADCSCEEVSDHLFEFLDAQMPEEQAARLRRHIETCPNCTQMTEAEAHVRDIVRRSCCESAPATLRVRITSQLAVYREVTE